MLLTHNINQLHSQLFSAIVLVMKFIVFEGLDGSGKSSLMKALEERLKKHRHSVLLSREPGGTALGDDLRHLILRKEAPVGGTPVPRAELLMYEASRAQHVDLVLRPALEKNFWVLCDRFTASSIAFQAGGRAIAEADVEWLNTFATQNLQADLTILLDLSVEESKKRRQSRSSITQEAEDRIESEADTFHEKVRQGFLKQAKAQPDKWLVLNAAHTPAQLLEEAWSVLQKRNWIS